jgi:glutamine synthetase adenylyltransferase
MIAGQVRDKNGTLAERLARCLGAGYLVEREAAILHRAAEFMRTLEHVVRLVTGRSRRWLPERERALERAGQLASAILGYPFSSGVEAELESTMREVREVYTRVLG